MGKRSRPINMLPICSDVGDQPKKGGGGSSGKIFGKYPILRPLTAVCVWKHESKYFRPRMVTPIGQAARPRLVKITHPRSSLNVDVWRRRDRPGDPNSEPMPMPGSLRGDVSR
eukprot:scaffold148379_cov32-Tisochrysis_lutea.AAC.4